MGWGQGKGDEQIDSEECLSPCHACTLKRVLSVINMLNCVNGAEKPSLSTVCGCLPCYPQTDLGRSALPAAPLRGPLPAPPPSHSQT